MPVYPGAATTFDNCSIRADELDKYVWAQVRQVLHDPRQLIAGERAVIGGTPTDRLDTALDSNERERTGRRRVGLARGPVAIFSRMLSTDVVQVNGVVSWL